MTTEAKFTTEQVEALKAQFDVLDEDGDGRISQAELQHILQRDAYAHLSEARRQAVLDSFASVDADGDGKITFEEYLELFPPPSENEEDMYRPAFDQYDLDGDGYLTAEDFKRIAEKQGSELSAEQAQEMIKMADENEDGKVSFDEFVEIMRRS